MTAPAVGSRAPPSAARGREATSPDARREADPTAYMGKPRRGSLAASRT